jgi:hypothetical protein
MEIHIVSMSAGRIVTCWRKPRKSSGEKKKKDDRPINHDITMACTTWGWMDDLSLATELMKRSGVVKVRVDCGSRTVEIEK